MGGRSDDSVPEHVPAAWTNKVLASRAAVADMLRPTLPMPPLFDGPEDDASAVALEYVELPVPAHVDDSATEPTRLAATSLGVAPLAPATAVRRPYVIPTSLASSREPAGGRASRTAMAPLDAHTGLPRRGVWDAMCGGLARSVRSFRWWLVRRRRTERVRRV